MRHPLASIAAVCCAAAVLIGCAQPALEDAPAIAPTQSGDHADRSALPEGFAYLSEVAPDIEVESRYATSNNFTGEVVDGYSDPAVAILRDEAAQALAAVQDEVEGAGLGLLIWDAFRPTRAVAHFVAWSATPDDSTKLEYYPDFEKPELFELGYIAAESRHSLGGTVDLTLISADTGDQLDMGGPFDFFGEKSHFDAEGLTAEQQGNRVLLREVMQKHGFEPYPLEWWHFTFPLPEGTEPADFAVS